METTIRVRNTYGSEGVLYVRDGMAYLFTNEDELFGYIPATGVPEELRRYASCWTLGRIPGSGLIERGTLDSLYRESGSDFLGADANRWFYPETEVVEPDEPEDVSTDGDFMSDSYSRGRIYTDVNGYHDSHEEDFMNEAVKASKREWRIGVELEVEARSAEKYEEISGWRSNWFTMERDGSLNSDGIEFITVPLRVEDAKNVAFWKKLTGPLAPLAKSWDSPRCGLHVHIGREILGERDREEVIGKLLYLYHYSLLGTGLNTGVFGRARAYNEKSCKTQYADAVDVIGREVLSNKSVKDKLSRSLRAKTMEDRYFDINLRNGATIEFRKGRGSINAERIVSVVTYCELMCMYAKRSSWESLTYEKFVKFLREKTAEGHPLRRFL